jgi:hypothetical protein
MDISHLAFHKLYMSAIDTVENPAPTRTALGRLAGELDGIAFPCIACGINLIIDPAIGQPDPTEDTHWDHRITSSASWRQDCSVGSSLVATKEKQHPSHDIADRTDRRPS